MRHVFLVVSLWMVLTLISKSSAENSFQEKLDGEVDSLIGPIKRLDHFRYFEALGKRRASDFSKNLIDKYRYFGSLGKRDLEDFV